MFTLITSFNQFYFEHTSSCQNRFIKEEIKNIPLKNCSPLLSDFNGCNRIMPHITNVNVLHFSKNKIIKNIPNDKIYYNKI